MKWSKVKICLGLREPIFYQETIGCLIVCRDVEEGDNDNGDCYWRWTNLIEFEWI